jgi:hypothetical protein
MPAARVAWITRLCISWMSGCEMWSPSPRRSPDQGPNMSPSSPPSRAINSTLSAYWVLDDAEDKDIGVHPAIVARPVPAEMPDGPPAGQAPRAPIGQMPG